MSTYRPFRRADYGFAPATVAKVAKIGGSDGRTLARLATLAGGEVETSAPEPQTLATLAGGTGETSAPGRMIQATSATSAEVTETGAENGISHTSAAKVANLAKVQATGPANDPPTWREALLGLSPDHDPCPGFRPRAWARVWASALAFVETHGAEAHGLGWAAMDLFGVHPAVGVIRVDCCGALMLSCADQVLAVEADRIRYENGLTFRRVIPAEGVPVWAFGRGDVP